MEKQNQSGSKYLRRVRGAVDGRIDVYAVLNSFDVVCPARQHAVKKLLCAGIRGSKDEGQDLIEARDAVERAIQLHAGLERQQEEPLSAIEQVDSLTEALPEQCLGRLCGRPV